MTVKNSEQGYMIPASLMHKLIISVIAAILTAGGYMVAWQVTDAAYKATTELRIKILENFTVAHERRRETREHLK